jgi:16S rRNA (guanine527-N7)-methyltransferase
VTRDELERRSGCVVPRETFDKLSKFVELVRVGAETQNLVSKTTLDDIWARHVLDSVQLIRLARQGVWLDLGTGAGFPGMVVAMFGFTKVILVEERRLRYQFLSDATAELHLENVTVVGKRLERVDTFQAETISARAFAPLDKLLRLSTRFASNKTRWILPKGKKALEELASVRAMWHGDFRLEPSVTDPDSLIVIAENVSLKGQG